MVPDVPARGAAVLAAALAITVPRAAAGAPPEPGRKGPPVHLGAEAATNVATDVGVRLSLEVPLRLRFSTSVGVLPGPYVDLINAVVVAAGGYDESTAELVRGALSKSLVWRTQVGWRFHPDWGFYLDAGYALAALGGGVTGQDVLVLATGKPAPQEAGQKLDKLSFSVGSRLHLLVAEAGYEWLLWDRLVIRAAAGFAGTVAAKTKAEAQFSTGRAKIDALITEFGNYGAAYLDDIYTSYVYTPTITVAAGYRFF
ncbi:MAG: hypothetical protein HY744_07285 [Deltaproteobacteria bacterium]|nr:hypothetical protein [Deltaproteobacteria bacterium]